MGRHYRDHHAHHAAVGSFLLLTATDKAGKTYERVPATVEGQHLGKHGEMILTVKTGFDGEERDIPCLPHQKACQAATTNDVVLIDGAYDFTGIRNNDEIRFIFSGPPR